MDGWIADLLTQHAIPNPQNISMAAQARSKGERWGINGHQTRGYGGIVHCRYTVGRGRCKLGAGAVSISSTVQYSRRWRWPSHHSDKFPFADSMTQWDHAKPSPSSPAAGMTRMELPQVSLLISSLIEGWINSELIHSSIFIFSHVIITKLLVNSCKSPSLKFIFTATDEQTQEQNEVPHTLDETFNQLCFFLSDYSIFPHFVVYDIDVRELTTNKPEFQSI
jgi:hypothetical protein